MPLFRRGGSVAVLHYDGSIPDPASDEFPAALKEQRFRTIENAASEEVSVGWVTPGDPSGGTFEAEDMEAGRARWMRIRIDKKALPRTWVSIHRAASERAAGRKLSAAEVRDLKEDLSDTLLPRVLPAVNLVDALLIPKEKKVLLMTTSSGTLEHFCKLFFSTFGVSLEPADPYRLALGAGLGSDKERALEQLAPVNWPVKRGGDGGKPLPARAVAAADPEVHAPTDAEEVTP